MSGGVQSGPAPSDPVTSSAVLVDGLPAGVRTQAPRSESPTRVVLVRHGEAECNVNGRVGGPVGCTGLSVRGVSQVVALARRLEHTGELSGTTALYASVLPRAMETAELLIPALERWRDGPALVTVTDCALCELHPGDADGLAWAEFAARFGEPDWDADPNRAIAPSGESWSGFIDRAASGVERVARAHPGGLVVIACHSGVVEATMARFLPIDRLRPPRNWLRVSHAAITEWELEGGRWMLRRYNDATPVEAGPELLIENSLSGDAVATVSRARISE